MQTSNVLFGLANYLINSCTSEGGWDSEPGSNKETNPLNTAEVLCGLISARHYLIINKTPQKYDIVIKNAINYLHKTQLNNGGWSTGSAYKIASPLKIANGNTVSTCFAFWALALNHSLIEKDSTMKTIINKVMKFLSECRRDEYLYSYSPNVEQWSPISTSYVLLTYCLIHSLDWKFNILNQSKKIEIETTICYIVERLYDENVLNEFKKQYISIIIMYYSILLFSTQNKNIPKFVLKKVTNILKKEMDNLTLEQCTTIYTEEQVIREDGKTSRDFTHYVSIWILLINSCSNNKERYYESQVLRTILDKIRKNGYNGVYLSAKRWTWATGLTLFSLSNYLTNLNIDELILKEGIHMSADNKKVFIVHGRDIEFKDKIVDFLRSLSLCPLEWEQVSQKTGKTTPTTFEIINKGFEMAQAIIILMSGDDEGRLKEKFLNDTDDKSENDFLSQPRLNVVFEAGLAFGINQDRTILVRKNENLRKISDIDGFNYIIYNGKVENKNTLISRLRTAGCAVDTSGNDWLRV